MIIKFEKISSVGRFRDFTANGKGDISFKDFTLIYADNGSGKTTLTSILRSLSKADETIVRNRLSTNHTLDQSIQIYINDNSGKKNSYTFGKNGWKNSIDNFEIFDAHFVNENIYSGFEISDVHKKKLHQFVVGNQGIAIKNKILKNKEDKETKKTEIDGYIKSLIQNVGFGLTENDINNYLKLKEKDAKDIDNKISNATITLKNAQSQKIIASQTELPKITHWNTLDFLAIKTDFTKTIEKIQDKALEKVLNEHIEKLKTNKLPDAEDWLRKGHKYISHLVEKSDSKNLNEIECPLCKQNLSSDIEIIKAYTQQFNIAFIEFLKNIQSHFETIDNYNLESYLQKSETEITSLNERLLFWKDYLPEEVQPTCIDFKVFEKIIKPLYNVFQKEANNKVKNPSETFNVKKFEDFESQLTEINRQITELNTKAVEYNKKIQEFKKIIKSHEVAQQELNSLQQIKKRFEKPINDVCEALINAKKGQTALEKEYSDLAKKEGENSNSFIKKYAVRINEYLRDVFDTPFQIKEMTHGVRVGKSKEAKVEYKLLLDGKEISFDPTQAFNVSDCLSEGDKSTIAFSFFLSRLDAEPSKLQDKILVFDDPLSSFDKNRRIKTSELIANLSTQFKQVIVLSHNEYFLWDLFKRIPKNKSALQIKQSFKNNSSIIDNYDIKFLRNNKYFNAINEIEQWQENPDIKQKDKILGNIRIILESFLRFRFYRCLGGVTAETFGSMIDELERTNSITFRNEIERIKILKELRLLNDISKDKHHGSNNPSYGETEIDIENMTDTELNSMITKTFNLIDNEL